jgi:hypothetical protein
MGANAALVGVALGAYGALLVPYLIHLPVEFAALTLGATGWFAVGVGQTRWLGHRIVAFALAVLVAAMLEVYATPAISQ